MEDLGQLLSITQSREVAREWQTWLTDNPELNRVEEIKKEKRWNTDERTVQQLLKRYGTQDAILEIYSPKRVNGIAEKLGLIPGMSLDLTVNDVDGKPWDFNIQSK